MWHVFLGVILIVCNIYIISQGFNIKDSMRNYLIFCSDLSDILVQYLHHQEVNYHQPTNWPNCQSGRLWPQGRFCKHVIYQHSCQREREREREREKERKKKIMDLQLVFQAQAKGFICAYVHFVLCKQIVYIRKYKGYTITICNYTILRISLRQVQESTPRQR